MDESGRNRKVEIYDKNINKMLASEKRRIKT